MHFEISVKDIKDEPLASLLDKAESHTLKCENALHEAAKAQEQAVADYNEARERAAALRDEYTNRRAKSPTTIGDLFKFEALD